MLLDARSDQALGVDEERAVIAVPRQDPPLGNAFAPRRLTLRGIPVFELALWCGTCPALFQKLTEPAAADLEHVHQLLGAGLEIIDDAVLYAYGTLLPRSSYTVLLAEFTPQLVSPGSASDYFNHEQVATWGVDPALGRAEDPGTPYYRTFQTPMSGDRHLYEFVVPMVPPVWNDRETVARYLKVDGAEPATAVAYSLLDVLQPAVDEGDDYYEHWVLTHFLLDGHHKVEAAAAAGRPVRLLSLVDESSSLASRQDLTALVRARARSMEARG